MVVCEIHIPMQCMSTRSDECLCPRANNQHSINAPIIIHFHGKEELDLVHDQGTMTPAMSFDFESRSAFRYIIGRSQHTIHGAAAATAAIVFVAKPPLCTVMTTELGRTARIAHNVSLKWHPFVTPDPFVNSASRLRPIYLFS